ncbi:hypothetical protein CPB85DRAFT_1251774 [Mucidula mucida]|nr:hypothetical protein CPB85DRAFT_1251774 [Mucidula mucida]
MSFAYTPNFHLAQANNELVLERGHSPATPKNKRVLVVGGGVTGFTTAWALLDAGYRVTIISDKWADPKDRIASQIAGALWEWPPAVCGKHTDVISLEKSKDWCMTSYHIFDKLQEWMPPVGNLKAFDHGVQMGMANFFFVEKLEEMADAGQLDKWNEIQEMSAEIKGVKRDPTLIHRHKVNKRAGVVDSYQHMSPMIDTDAYMRWLQFVVTCKGREPLHAERLVQPHEYSLDLKMDSPEIQRMRARCNNFVPGWRTLRPAAVPWDQRPHRAETRKNGSRIIHSYGHGGSGFTLSFGCARDVLGLVYDLEKDLAVEGTHAHL